MWPQSLRHSGQTEGKDRQEPWPGAQEAGSTMTVPQPGRNSHPEAPDSRAQPRATHGTMRSGLDKGQGTAHPAGCSPAPPRGEYPEPLPGSRAHTLHCLHGNKYGADQGSHSRKGGAHFLSTCFKLAWVPRASGRQGSWDGPHVADEKTRAQE